VPVGVSIADLIASIHLAQGITALLYRRERTGKGGLIETSLIEGMLDLQFELLSTFFTKPGLEISRGGVRSANGFLPAPYGIYPTTDGYLALAMNPVDRLGSLIGDDWLASLTEPEAWTEDVDRISEALTRALAKDTLAHWLSVLDPADVWCAPVLTLPELAQSEGFQALDMMQDVSRTGLDGNPSTMTTTRSPIRIDGQNLAGSAPAPRVGEHSESIRVEFGI
jgi:crotonobetainyl-CoA:carnitine CoA-transferase CaiB-like acyl-CoA transferase